MQTIETFQPLIRSLAGDPNGKRYDDAMLQLAMRTAMREYDAILPNLHEVSLPLSVAHGRTLMLDWQPESHQRLAAIRWTDAIGRLVTPAFQLSLTGSGCQIETDTPVPLSADSRITLLIQQPHTLSGLDGELTTTLPGRDTLLLAEGAAGHAMRIRAASVTEVFGKRPEDAASLLRQAQTMLDSFRISLTGLSRNSGSAPLPAFPHKGFPV